MKSAADKETERIVQWRRERARELGYEFAEVEIIGDEWHIDLERLRDLILGRGCRPMTALRIVR